MGPASRSPWTDFSLVCLFDYSCGLGGEQVDSWFLDERQAREFREPDLSSPINRAFDSASRSPRFSPESPSQQGWPVRRDDTLLHQEQSPYLVDGRPILGSLEVGDGPAPSGLLTGQPRWAMDKLSLC